MNDHDTSDLEIGEGDYSDRFYRGQQIGRVLLLVLVVATAIGVAGHGPLSWTTSAGADGQLEVSYERFGRRGGNQDLTVRVPAAAAHDGVWEVMFDGDLPGNFTIDAVTPDPSSVAADESGVRFTFEQAAPDADLVARFSVRPSGLWRERGHVSVNADRVAVRQFIYP